MTKGSAMFFCWIWKMNVVNASLLVRPPAKYLISARTTTDGTVRYESMNLEGCVCSSNPKERIA